MDDNTIYIAEAIFSKPPGEKGSIDLGIEDPETINNYSNDPVLFTNEILTKITMYGVYILYGHSDITLLTERNVNLIREYTLSYGYDIRYEIEEKIMIEFIRI